MIVTSLKGGLGNQMFQYAAGFAASLRCNTSLKVDCSWFDSQRGNTSRTYELGIFGISAASFPWWWRSAFIRNKLFPTIKEPSNLSFCNKLMVGVNRNIILNGYWPSEKYFVDYQAEIRKQFSFPQKMSASVRKYIRQIGNSNAVSIHIRRGDYANDPKTKAFHGLLPISYYKNAIALIAERIKNPTFFIFSDDLDWAKNHLTSKLPMEFVSHDGLAYEDMRLMSMCKHHIIANSTFSWWGAWLNPSKGKIVISPNKWFENKSINATNILPENWKTL